MQSTLTGATTIVNSNGGNDTINVSSNAPINTGTLSGILGALNINTGANASAVGDTLNVSDLGGAAGQTVYTGLGGGDRLDDAHRRCGCDHL